MLPEEVLDLLIAQSMGRLSSEEQRVLEAQDGAVMRAYAHDFERAAAAISLAANAWPLDLPSEMLRSRIERGAKAFFANTDVNAVKSHQESLPIRWRVNSRTSLAGWYAAAACLVLAVFGWLRPSQLTGPPHSANIPAPASPIVGPQVPTPAPPTLAEERAALLALSGSVKVNLSATQDPAADGVTADAVWDPASQRGYLRIVGLRSNDPRIAQYQAWVFDAERDKRYPLDAGIFDVPANSSEVIVPIHAELPVRVAKAFAVTLEKPGGVVVSALHHVVVLGAAT